jgi:hypothetical protein
MRFWLPLIVGILVALELVVTFVWVKRVRPWWWGLRKGTRVLIGSANILAITAAAAVLNLG